MSRRSDVHSAWRKAGLRALLRAMDRPDVTMGQVIDAVLDVVDPLLRADEREQAASDLDAIVKRRMTDGLRQSRTYGDVLEHDVVTAAYQDAARVVRGSRKIEKG